MRGDLRSFYRMALSTPPSITAITSGICLIICGTRISHLPETESCIQKARTTGSVDGGREKTAVFRARKSNGEAAAGDLFHLKDTAVKIIIEQLTSV
jgi:hypothetical protein